ncbi:uncharacterized protein LOC128230517 isoform X2 [Mya arenaria]|nr:uncharacterized protein LOC128230517 isoform X2 [Mya arenaria]
MQKARPMMDAAQPNHHNGIVLLDGFCKAIISKTVKNDDDKYNDVFVEITSSCEKLQEFWTKVYANRQGMAQAGDGPQVQPETFDDDEPIDQPKPVHGERDRKRRSNRRPFAWRDGFRVQGRRPIGLPMAKSAIEQLLFICDHLNPALEGRSVEFVEIVDQIDEACEKADQLFHEDADDNATADL